MPNENQPATRMWSGRLRETLNGRFRVGRQNSAFLYLRKLIVLFAVAATLMLFAAASAQSPPSNLAIVTFYSNGKSLSGGLPGHKSEAFNGPIFVDHQELATLHAGTFVSFAFAPGQHKFVAGSKRVTWGLPESSLTLTLASGQRYFIEVRTRPVPIPPFGFQQTTCQEARSDNTTDRPLGMSDIKPAGASAALGESAFPDCAADPPTPPKESAN